MSERALTGALVLLRRDRSDIYAPFDAGSSMLVRRKQHLIDADDQLLERARVLLGIGTTTDTVNAALAQVVAPDARAGSSWTMLALAHSPRLRITR